MSTWWNREPTAEEGGALTPEPEPVEYCAACNAVLERIAIEVWEPAYPYRHQCCSETCAADVRARLEAE